MIAILRVVLCLLFFAAAAQARADQAIIVLDASGSMWGQIGGETKMDIAKRTLATVLGTVPSTLELGMMAYGHRDKGSCADIELMVSPAAGSANTVAAAAYGINPKGKTPLADAVRQAAEILRFTEEKATVILVTDGIETCEADPCAVASTLEAAGVDLTVHVVGFGLSDDEGRQVACLAENTGGQYLPAGDAAMLGAALTQTVAQTVAPAPPASRRGGATRQEPQGHVAAGGGRAALHRSGRHRLRRLRRHRRRPRAERGRHRIWRQRI
jgi:Ca-activated chloride channel family protein